MPITITKATCSVDGCDRPVHGWTYCDPHYKRYRKYGDATYGGRIKIKDGRTKDPRFVRYCNMKQRCYNSRYAEFYLYGGRGIKICDDWRDDFASFIRDMGPLPSPLHEIDRIDTDGNYEPSNCRWATPNLNAVNRRAPTSRSGFLNVIYRRSLPRRRYVVYLKVMQQRVYVGRFDTDLEAAWMADQYRIALWGEDVPLNLEYI